MGMQALQIEERIEGTKKQTLDLLGSEEELLAAIDEAAGLKGDEAIEAQAEVLAASEALIAFAKEMKDQADRAKKRIAETVAALKGDLLEQVEAKGGEIKVKNWTMIKRKNPVSVVVDDLEAVPKVYRKVPKPLPDWELWPVDKTRVKNALTSQSVQSIRGVHLDDTGARVEIKRR